VEASSSRCSIAGASEQAHSGAGVQCGSSPYRGCRRAPDLTGRPRRRGRHPQRCIVVDGALPSPLVVCKLPSGSRLCIQLSVALDHQVPATEVLVTVPTSSTVTFIEYCPSLTSGFLPECFGNSDLIRYLYKPHGKSRSRTVLVPCPSSQRASHALVLTGGTSSPLLSLSFFHYYYYQWQLECRSSCQPATAASAQHCHCCSCPLLLHGGSGSGSSTQDRGGA
jgi:hypothetical protein